MLALRFKSLALCLAVCPWLVGPGIQKPTRGAGRAWQPQTEQERLRREVIGFWECTSITGDGNTYRGADLKGYLLFATDHLAFEYHYRAPTGVRDVDAYSFQSGIHRYRFDGMGRMETSSLIGAGGGDAEEGIDFEEPGLPRAFNIELHGDTLVLAHTFSRFEYRRIATTPYTDLEPGINFDERLPKAADPEQTGQSEE